MLCDVKMKLIFNSLVPFLVVLVTASSCYGVSSLIYCHPGGILVFNARLFIMQVEVGVKSCESSKGYGTKR